jgi:hypothetical protein
MSRESDELGERQHNQQFLVQPGNPDDVGYPGEPEGEPSNEPINPTPF